ncbi:conserved hypothetical protein [Methylobacterium sp. 4-46]|uniref:hypothetical protein n=1 Tax=unclassified Methylobacterium TaxID=2615210 RepID=UPI000152CE3E|nr:MULTISPECIES: hypothetical protein [Methylobacterium]ACA15997.1 conserved hypothetical protein [Methylobacterium sp. 4-46]WFT81711.1 hypothetical protein QA634_07565 [Methylobacterium nodulans]
MTLAKFRDEPWQTSHPMYSQSALAMTPAPEYASSEVILSSLYRAAGFQGLSEGSVPQAGRDLDREIRKYRNRKRSREGAALDADSFNMMLHSALESPKLPSKASKRFLQVMPIVPQTAAFSGSARLAGNPWSPGVLVRRMVWLGASSAAAAEKLWANLFDALSVANDDDIFARFLQRELAAWASGSVWTRAPSIPMPMLDLADQDGLRYPARQFAEDIEAIIDAKSSLTRRQWTSLLEAILRIGVVSHVLWLCEIHDRTWRCVRSALSGGGPTTLEEAREAMLPRSLAMLSYGDRALAMVKDQTSAFLMARLGLNATLWSLAEGGKDVPGNLWSAAGVLALCEGVRADRATLDRLGLAELVSELQERENHTIICRKGIGSNITEFARHVLGQRQAANAVLRGYDQGYALRKRGTRNSSPWIVALGPVAVLALVHCALSKTSGPRSVRRLAQHLRGYGISVDHRDIAQNDLGHQLRMLGLVLDSPDAESGMLLVPPFVEAAA